VASFNLVEYNRMYNNNHYIYAIWLNNIFWIYVGRYKEFFLCAPSLCRCKTFTRGAFCYYRQNHLCVILENGSTSSMGQRVRACGALLIRIYYIGVEYTCCNYTALLYCIRSVSTHPQNRSVCFRQ